jgi:hypothetical protein
MANDKLDYAWFISDIDAKIAALQALRASFQAAAALGALGQQAGGLEPAGVLPVRNGAPGIPHDLPEGAFMGKSVPACIELFLSAVKKKKTNKEIAEALREGGVESNAKDFDSVITGALFGLKQAGKVLRFKDGWGLAEWYPAHIRGVAAAPATKKSGSKKRKKKLKRDTEPVAATDKEVQSRHPKSVPADVVISTQDRIVELLRSKPNVEFSPQEIVASLPDVKANVIHLLLGRLTDRKKAERTASGSYRLASNLHQMASAG